MFQHRIFPQWIIVTTPLGFIKLSIRLIIFPETVTISFWKWSKPPHTVDSKSNNFSPPANAYLEQFFVVDVIRIPINRRQWWQLVSLGSDMQLKRHYRQNTLQFTYIENLTCSVHVCPSISYMYMSVHIVHTTSRSDRGEALCREVLLYLFFETRFVVHLLYKRGKGVPCTHGSVYYGMFPWICSVPR